MLLWNFLVTWCFVAVFFLVIAALIHVGMMLEREPVQETPPGPKAHTSSLLAPVAKEETTPEEPLLWRPNRPLGDSRPTQLTSAELADFLLLAHEGLKTRGQRESEVCLHPRDLQPD